MVNVKMASVNVKPCGRGKIAPKKFVKIIALQMACASMKIIANVIRVRKLN
jgi:hypothetical protein